MIFIKTALFKLSFILSCLSIISVEAGAQNKTWDKPKETYKEAAKKLDKKKGVVKQWKEHVTTWGLAQNYQRQLSVGGKLNSNGWSGCIYYLIKTKPDKHTVWQLSFSEIKHEKQIKQQRSSNPFPELGKATPFVFGKVNNLYALQLGWAKEQLLLPGILEDNLSVSFRYGGGLSLAMLKPYYLNLYYIEYTPQIEAELKTEKYNDANADVFLKETNIQGAEKWSKGLGEMQYIPGVYVGTAFVIVPANTKTFVQTITLGANGAFYTNKLPTMALIKAYRWQASLFVGVALGKRW